MGEKEDREFIELSKELAAEESEIPIEIPEDYAGILISPTGEITCYLPNHDDPSAYIDMPTWIATVMMTAIQDEEIRNAAELLLRGKMSLIEVKK